MKGTIVWSGYITANEKASTTHDKFKKDNPEVGNFIEDVADVLDKMLFRGEVD